MKPKKKRVHTPWDDAFKQLMQEVLGDLGLLVIEDPKLGKLPLKADLVLISPKEANGAWHEHPIWQYLTDQSLVEFKSVADPLLPGDFEVLLAYTLLYRVKFKLGYDTRLSSWLIIPAANKHLKAALKHYQIKLTEILPGFWQAKTLFPLYVVAYNQLPTELPYQTLKVFIKSGTPVQEVFLAVLESEYRQNWVKAIQTAMDLVHPKDLKEVLKKVGLATQRQELRETLKELLKDDLEKDLTAREQKGKLEGELEGELKGELKAKHEMARQMKADGIPLDRICKYTGLSTKEVKKL